MNKNDYPKVIIAFLLSMGFLAASMILFSPRTNIIWLVPPALLLLLLAFISVEKLLYLTVFLAPLSIQLRFIIPETAVDAFLPTEIILPVILVLMIFKMAVTREIDRRIISHPLTIIVFLMLAWSFITSLTGNMPLVSLKSVIARGWFIAGFYILAAEIFKRKEQIRTYFMAYIAGMVPVTIFFLVNMWNTGIFSKEAVYTSTKPFFNDHTIIGAALAFCIPLNIWLMSGRVSSGPKKLFLFFSLIIFSAGSVFSYSRAAWLSMAAAAFVVLLLVSRISWKIIVPVMTVLTVIIITSWTSLMIRLGENRQDSSGDLSMHVQSISNIRTDASNMERLNRWKSALRMFAEKPLLGRGPATYQFQYAPYQLASEKTIISTNYGERGNAHSEYLTALVDSGIPGLLLYLALIAVFLRKGLLLYRRTTEKETRHILLAMIAGLTTYIIHGGLNNFLDTDKISALFWGMIAAIAALDLSREKESGEIVRKDQQQ